MKKEGFQISVNDLIMNKVEVKLISDSFAIRLLILNLMSVLISSRGFRFCHYIRHVTCASLSVFPICHTCLSLFLFILIAIAKSVSCLTGFIYQAIRNTYHLPLLYIESLLLTDVTPRCHSKSSPCPLINRPWPCSL